MKRHLWRSVAAGLLALGAAGEAAAQSGQYPYYQRPLNTFPQPALSPYLNLSPRANVNPGFRYFLQTLPELDRRAANLTFGSAIAGIDQRLAFGTQAELMGLLPEPLGATGHPAYFNTYGSYFSFAPTRGAPTPVPSMATQPAPSAPATGRGRR